MPNGRPEGAVSRFLQLLLLVEPAHDAADRIYRSIVATTEGAASLVPMLRPFDVTGSTRWVDFDTTKPVFETAPDKCHVSHVVADTGSWEQNLAQTHWEERKDKAAKVATARTLWIPAFNNHGGFGRWAFVEVTDPWNAKNTIRAALAEAAAEMV